MNSTWQVWDLRLTGWQGGWRGNWPASFSFFDLLRRFSRAEAPAEKGTEQFFFPFWFWRRFNFAVRSAGAVAAVLEDALLEERRELTDGVFAEMETAVFIDSERRAGGRQHHPEQVPQITLQKNNSSTEWPPTWPLIFLFLTEQDDLS